MAVFYKTFLQVFLTVALLIQFCHSVAVIPKIFLFSQKEFDGNSLSFLLYPGCNNIFQFGWDKATVSIANNKECIVIHDGMYCQGRSIKITLENEQDLRNLPDIGFIHRFPSGLSSVEKCESEVCTALGTFIKPGYCTKYFRCTENPDVPGTYIKKNFACPPKQRFDPKLGHCNTPDKVSPKLACNETLTH